MHKLFCLLLLTPLLVPAQIAEIGATAGGGAFGAEELGPTGFGVFGAELCAPCSRRVAAFVEFNRWENAGGGNPGARIDSVNMFAGGIRIQRTGRVRPFFDAGLAAAWDRYTWRNSTDTYSTHTSGSAGLVLGGGAAISLGRNWYIRPQFRAYTLSYWRFGLVGMVGVGYRF